MTAPRTALVTGANQNLGRALVGGLAACWGPDDRVLLTGRDRDRVQTAAEELQADCSSGATIEPRVLDVRDSDAIAELATELGRVDVVFSNATSRVRPESDPAAEVDAVVETNNLATTAILRAFAPRMCDGGRLIIVASALGTLDKVPGDSARQRFAEAAMSGLDAVDHLVEEWRAAVLAGRAADEGFGRWLNIPSKVAQVAAVRAVAAARRDDDIARGVLIAALCPGLIDTDASRPWFDDMSSAQAPEEAAGWPVELATSPGRTASSFYGELVQFGRVIPWTTGMAVPHRALD